MFWMFLAIGIVGLLTGFFFRAGAPLLLSVVIAVVTILYGAADGWPLWSAGLYAIGLTAALQISYLIALLFNSACPTRR